MPNETAPLIGWRLPLASVAMNSGAWLLLLALLIWFALFPPATPQSDAVVPSRLNFQTLPCWSPAYTRSTVPLPSESQPRGPERPLLVAVLVCNLVTAPVSTSTIQRTERSLVLLTPLPKMTLTEPLLRRATIGSPITRPMSASPAMSNLTSVAVNEAGLVTSRAKTPLPP